MKTSTECSCCHKELKIKDKVVIIEHGDLGIDWRSGESFISSNNLLSNYDDKVTLCQECANHSCSPASTLIQLRKHEDFEK
jgi:hypothetical protein